MYIVVIDVARTDILVHLPCAFMYIIHGLEVRYGHVQEEVEQLRRGRVVREGGGGKKGDRECGGGRGGQARNEIEAGGHQAPMYANIKVVV